MQKKFPQACRYILIKEYGDVFCIYRLHFSCELGHPALWADLNWLINATGYVFLSSSASKCLWNSKLCKSLKTVVIVQPLSQVWLFVTPWTAACQASLSFTISQSLLKLMSVELVMTSNYLILCHSLPLLPSIFPSIRIFSNELALHIRWLKYWSFNLSISPSSECSGLISFRMDWLDLLAVQGTLKSLLQHHSLKTSVLQHSVFFMVQLAHLYMTTGKTIALTVRSFVGKVMSLLFNMLSRFVRGVKTTFWESSGNS